MAEHESDTQALVEFLKETHGLKGITPDYSDGNAPTLLAMPNGIVVRDLTENVDAARLAPLRKSGSTELHSVASFVAYVNWHKGAGTVNFANEPGLSAASLFGHHAVDAPGFGRFRGAYRLPKSDEWKAWLAKNDAVMTQTDFAAFLEDRILDVVAADPKEFPQRIRDATTELNARIAGPSQMMELSRGLSVFSKGEATVKVDISSGEATVRFEDEHVDGKGKPVRVPNLFVISVPIVRQGAPYLIPVRLRYRAKEGQIAWWYSIWRPEVFIADAFADIRKEVSEGTDAVVLDGEAPRECPAR